jgi:hypothetical protein
MAERLSAERRKWQMQEDLATLQRASEIQADKKRLSAVQKHANEQVKALSKVAAAPKAKAPAKKKGK